jgi:hypothetical protein
VHGDDDGSRGARARFDEQGGEGDATRVEGDRAREVAGACPGQTAGGDGEVPDHA